MRIWVTYRIVFMGEEVIIFIIIIRRVVYVPSPEPYWLTAFGNFISILIYKFWQFTHIRHIPGKFYIPPHPLTGCAQDGLFYLLHALQCPLRVFLVGLIRKYRRHKGNRQAHNRNNREDFKEGVARGDKRTSW